MKITQKTESELVAKEGNFLGIVIGVLSIAAGGGFMYANGFHFNDQWFVILLPILFIIIGVLSILFSSTITISISKITGQILYRKKSLVKDTTTTYAIGDVLQVEMRRTWETEQIKSSDQSGVKSRQVLISQGVLIFKDGRELLLSQQKSASVPVGVVTMSGTQNGEHGYAGEIAAFLGVEFKVLSPSRGALGLDVNIGGIQL